jgi:hypothetical protein
MKLKEIILETIDITKSTPVDFKGTEFFPISGDLAGQGVQAMVYHTGQGVVTKMAIIHNEVGESDPTLIFLKLILQHRDNPFFPKIYHAKIYEDKTGEQSHKLLLIQMEKLTSIENPKMHDVVMELFQRLGLISQDRIQKIQRRGIQQKNDLETIRHATLYNAAIGIDDLTDRWASKTKKDKLKAQVFKTAKNPKFKQAIQILEPYMQEYGSDMHEGNWMVRLTGAGPQLVIIDPFQPLSFQLESGM